MTRNFPLAENFPSYDLITTSRLINVRLFPANELKMLNTIQRNLVADLLLDDGRFSHTSCFITA